MLFVASFVIEPCVPSGRNVLATVQGFSTGFLARVKSIPTMFGSLFILNILGETESILQMIKSRRAPLLASLGPPVPTPLLRYSPP